MVAKRPNWDVYHLSQIECDYQIASYWVQLNFWKYTNVFMLYFFSLFIKNLLSTNCPGGKKSLVVTQKPH